MPRQPPSPSVRTILPLAAVTSTSMLAMDLYLPAVPALQRGLDISVPEGQATIAIFLAGLAGSQLLWGEALHRWGPKACVKAGLWLLIAASIGCALAQEIVALLGFRLVQGVAAGAATVVAPTVIRATLPDRDGVKGIAAVSMIEAIIPAAGPALGAALLVFMDWRWIFAVLAILTLVAAPFALAATPRVLPEHDHAGGTGYLELLKNRRYVRIALAHALCFAALLTFVASAPQVLQALGMDASAFVISQVGGVAAFIVAASQSGRFSARVGAAQAIRLGAWMHVLLCTGLFLASLAESPPFPLLLAFWMTFCGVLGIRGPAAVSEALTVPTGQMGRASAVLVLALLVAASIGTQAAGTFLESHGIIAVALVMAGLSFGSLVLGLGPRECQSQWDVRPLAPAAGVAAIADAEPRTTVGCSAVAVRECRTVDSHCRPH
jgi:DHA1 family bicyclomycin/chloramphenicol resistance-like MFS transporter